MLSGMKIQIIIKDKIGDVIICMPIAQYYKNKGYNVTVVVREEIISNFNSGHFPGIVFKTNVSPDVDTLDLSYNSTKLKYKKQTKYTFDEYKYYLAKVPFMTKWELAIKRDRSREDALYLKVNPNNELYYLFCSTTSDYELVFDLKTNNNIKHITKLSNCVFDWLYTIERAQGVILTESCFSNLIDQLKIKIPIMFLILSPGRDNYFDQIGRSKGRPILKSKWNILKYNDC